LKGQMGVAGPSGHFLQVAVESLSSARDVQERTLKGKKRDVAEEHGLQA
jgi:hypothetical protein